MHHALRLDEIIRCICEQLHSQSRRRMKADLLKFSLSCKLWKDPGLDFLWNTPLRLDEVLTPLIAAGILAKEPEWPDALNIFEIITTRISLLRPLEKVDWCSYKSYAARVVDVYLDTRCYASEELFEGMLKHESAGGLFPRIRVLSLCHEGLSHISSAKHFLSPSIQSLWIPVTSFGAKSHPLTQFLKDCGPHKANLKCISLISAKESTFEFPADRMGVFLSELPKLKTLTMDASDLFITNILSSSIPFDSLTHLSLRPRDTWNQTFNFKVDGSNFPGLQTVAMFVDVGPRHLDALRAFALAPALQNVKLDIVGCYLDEIVLLALEHLSGAIASSPGLQSITLSSHRACAASIRRIGGSIHITHLHHLSYHPYRSLRRLHISGTASFDFADSDLKSIAEWCPLLESMEMITYLAERYCQPLPTITISAMVCFSQKLPCLKHLVLPVVVGCADIKRNHGGAGPSLEVWDMSYSTVEDPLKAASFLIMYFPSLEKVYSSYARPGHTSHIDWSALGIWGQTISDSMANIAIIGNIVGDTVQRRKLRVQEFRSQLL